MPQQSDKYASRRNNETTGLFIVSRLKKSNPIDRVLKILYSVAKPSGGAGGVLSPGMNTTGGHGWLSPTELYAETQR